MKVRVATEDDIEAGEWISVKDFTPKDGWRLVFTDGTNFDIGFYDAGASNYYGTTVLRGVEVPTHWLALPVLPEESEFELEFCGKCIQMTNHIDGVCQKCKA